MTMQKQTFSSPIGNSVQRKEGPKKVTGRSKYIDDIEFKNCLHGTTIRSTIPRGKIKQINFAQDIPWHEFTVVTAKDIPGQNHVALITTDQPFLADTDINHAEEPILLLAHQDKILLERARQAITIDYETLPPVLSIPEAVEAQTIIWGKDNILKSYHLEKGNIDSIWSKADFIIEDTYET